MADAPIFVMLAILFYGVEYPALCKLVPDVLIRRMGQLDSLNHNHG